MKFELFIFMQIVFGNAYTNDPFGIEFDSTGFVWQQQSNVVNIPDYNRISFYFIQSSSRPCPKVKLGIRIISLLNSKPLFKTIFLNKNTHNAQVNLTRIEGTPFFVYIRVFVSVPNETKNIWAINEYGPVFNSREHFRHLV